jgi:hypothetical protein
VNRTAITAIALVLIGTGLTVAGVDLPAGLCLLLGGILSMLAGGLGLARRQRTDIVIARAVLLIVVGFWVTLTGFAVAASA